jgi:hypothetical protein
LYQSATMPIGSFAASIRMGPPESGSFISNYIF